MYRIILVTTIIILELSYLKSTIVEFNVTYNVNLKTYIITIYNEL